MTNKQLFGTPFSATANGTGSAIFTVTVGSTQCIFITDISASSDNATATFVLQSGSTTIWKDRISSTAPYQISFVQPLSLAAGVTLTGTANGSAVCYCNVSGFYGNLS